MDDLMVAWMALLMVDLAFALMGCLMGALALRAKAAWKYGVMIVQIAAVMMCSMVAWMDVGLAT